MQLSSEMSACLRIKHGWNIFADWSHWVLLVCAVLDEKSSSHVSVLSLIVVHLSYFPSFLPLPLRCLSRFCWIAMNKWWVNTKMNYCDGLFSKCAALLLAHVVLYTPPACHKAQVRTDTHVCAFTGKHVWLCRHILPKVVLIKRLWLVYYFSMSFSSMQVWH